MGEKEEKEEKVEKIEPKEVYLINKNNFVDQAKVLAKICMTLKFTKREPIDPDIFMEYVTKGLAFGKCIIFVSFDKDLELIACAVAFLLNNPLKGKIIWLEWCWTDGKDLDIGNKMFERIEDLAKTWGATRIAAAMTRTIAGVAKKYKMKKAYTVVEKILKGSDKDEN